MTGTNLSCPPRVCMWAMWINILQRRRLWGVVFNLLLLDQEGLRPLGNLLPWCTSLKYSSWVSVKLLLAHVKARTIKMKSTESCAGFLCEDVLFHQAACSTCLSENRTYSWNDKLLSPKLCSKEHCLPPWGAVEPAASRAPAGKAKTVDTAIPLRSLWKSRCDIICSPYRQLQGL